MSVEEFFMGILGILLTLTVICVCCNIACYLIKAFTLFVLAKRANAPRAWFAFIPFLQNMKLYNLAGYSEKAFLEQKNSERNPTLPTVDFSTL